MILTMWDVGLTGHLGNSDGGMSSIADGRTLGAIGIAGVFLGKRRVALMKTTVILMAVVSDRRWVSDEAGRSCLASATLRRWRWRVYLWQWSR